MKQQLFVRAKNAINWFQCRYQPRVRQSLQNANALIAAVNGVKVRIEQFHNRPVTLINETGCHISANPLKEKKSKDTFDIIWVGKFDFRKQLKLALQIMHILSERKAIKLHICGTGTNSQVLYYKNMANKLGLQDTVIWHGSVPHEDILSMMQHNDLFMFTSIMEGTPHVVLEALESNLPIICFDCCGMGAVVDDSVGTKIVVSSPTQSAEDFSKAILEYYHNPELLTRKAIACSRRQQELSWASKASQMMDIYEAIITKPKINDLLVR